MGVAQLDRAFGYGPKGRGFESSRPRWKSLQIACEDFYHTMTYLEGNSFMEKKTINCEVCENHCRMEAEVEDGEVVDVAGNGCMKGYIYAQTAVADAPD